MNKIRILKYFILSLIILVLLSCDFIVPHGGMRGLISTVAGNGSVGSFGDNGPAAEATLNYPYGISFDNIGNLYIVENNGCCVRKVDKNGIITTAAGNGTPGYSGDNGPAVAAQLYDPTTVAFDVSGNMYISDTYNCCIRKVNAQGIITTVAGTGIPGYSGDNGPATAAQLQYPRTVTFDAEGNMYIADESNWRIRKVDTGVTITTIAGNGTWGYSGDNIPAVSAQLKQVYCIAFSAAGDLYFTDDDDCRIRKVNKNGMLTTVAGDGIQGYSGNNGPALSATLNNPMYIDFDGSGNLFIAEFGNNCIREVDSSGIITTVAGDGSQGFWGDNGSPLTAEFDEPSSIAFDPDGNLYIADFNNCRVRKIWK